MNEEDSEKQCQPDSTTSETPMTSRTDHVPPGVESIQGAGDRASTRRAGQDHQEEFGDGSKPSQTTPSVESNGMLSPVNILERLLALQSLQWLMAVGGGMMVLGLIILLWINDFFTPVITACALASANLCVLGVGFSLLRFSKQQLVGQALTLLACLIMPLNLWYYSADGLVTIDGHLWLPASAMCAIYAAAAVPLKDKLFV